MALPKRVKHGGSFFKGYQLAVLSTAGAYVLHISRPENFVVNSITFICSDSGAGDYLTAEVYNTTSGGSLLTTLAESMYNPGPGVSMILGFPALEHVAANNDLRFTYVNSGSVALDVNVYVEHIK